MNTNLDLEVGRGRRTRRLERLSEPTPRLVELPLPDALAILSRLLEYPVGDMAQFRFTESEPLLAMTPDDREEAYTATFDVTPACVPYVSIHLFGEENFKRGEFMAELGGRCQAMNFDCRGELPDHLANMLRLAAIMDDEERCELLHFCVLGPLTKMISGLGDGNPYRPILKAVEAVVQAAYPGLEAPPSPVDEKSAHGGCGTCDAKWDHDRDYITGAATEPTQQ